MKLCGFATVIPFEHMRIRSESESLYIPVVTSVYSRPILPHSVAASLALLEIGIPTVPRVHMRFRLKSQRPSIFNELGVEILSTLLLIPICSWIRPRTCNERFWNEQILRDGSVSFLYVPSLLALECVVIVQLLMKLEHERIKTMLGIVKVIMS